MDRGSEACSEKLMRGSIVIRTTVSKAVPGLEWSRVNTDWARRVGSVGRLNVATGAVG